MSYDFRLESVCTHQVVLEQLGLEDYQYLRPISPLSSFRVELYCNGVALGSDGLYSKATTLFSKTGYFDIRTGANDTVQLGVDRNAVQTYMLKAGVLTIDQIAVDLQQKIPSVSITVQNGYLQVQSKYVGSVSTLFWGDGTAHMTLGIPVDQWYGNKEIYPSWGVVDDPTALISDQRMVQFSKPIHSTEDVFELTYFTSSPSCRRCRGLKLENDFRYDTKGEKLTLKDEDLMAQEIEKAYLIIKGSNPFHPWMGTRLIKLVGTKNLGYIKAQAMQELSAAMKNLKDIKLQQSQLQIVTPGEYPDSINVTKLDQYANDPTIIDIEITSISRRGQPVKVGQLLKLNDPQLPTNSVNQGFIRRLGRG